MNAVRGGPLLQTVTYFSADLFKLFPGSAGPGLGTILGWGIPFKLNWTASTVHLQRRQCEYGAWLPATTNITIQQISTVVSRPGEPIARARHSAHATGQATVVGTQKMCHEPQKSTPWNRLTSYCLRWSTVAKFASTCLPVRVANCPTKDVTSHNSTKLPGFPLMYSRPDQDIVLGDWTGGRENEETLNMVYFENLHSPSCPLEHAQTRRRMR